MPGIDGTWNRRSFTMDFLIDAFYLQRISNQATSSTRHLLSLPSLFSLLLNGYIPRHPPPKLTPTFRLSNTSLHKSIRSNHPLLPVRQIRHSRFRRISQLIPIRIPRPEETPKGSCEPSVNKRIRLLNRVDLVPPLRVGAVRGGRDGVRA